jgi:hypothetical protein
MKLPYLTSTSIPSVPFLLYIFRNINLYPTVLDDDHSMTLHGSRFNSLNMHQSFADQEAPLISENDILEISLVCRVCLAPFFLLGVRSGENHLRCSIPLLDVDRLFGIRFSGILLVGCSELNIVDLK